MKTTDKTKPAACPFCRGNARVKHGTYNDLGAYGDKKDDKTWFAVYCTICKVSQPSRCYHSKKTAIDAWNQRM